MREKKLADLFNVKSRFLRSAHLERDFDDPEALSGFVPTDFVCSCLGRLAEGTKPRSGHRAWRLTGDYGSGKSSFGLLAAHWLAGRDSTFPAQLRRVTHIIPAASSRPAHVPVLVTCGKQPLAGAILKSLCRALASVYGRRAKPKLLQAVQRLLGEKHAPTDDEIFDLILEVNAQVIADGKGTGLLLMVDELGKFLEFAAQHPDREDVFLLQRLAEAASRSGDEALFLVCLLHQGFSAYANDLSQAAQREWEKVSGRFEEIVFRHPVEQVVELIASALNVRTGQIPRGQIHSVQNAMEKTIALGWFESAPKDVLLDSAPRLFPLHPTVLPALVRVFRRFGQNERSLFSFLGSTQLTGHASLSWFHQGRELEIKDGRQLLEELSQILDRAYRNAPRIHNELVNRHSLSSAAAAARKRCVLRRNRQKLLAERLKPATHRASNFSETFSASAACWA